MPFPLVTDIDRLENEVRLARIDDLVSLYCAGSGHIGGSMSSMEILTVLYRAVMQHDPSNPKWDGRDYFVMSKGHGCPALYVTLGRCGYFERSHLWTLRHFGSILQGHPDMLRTPGVEFSTGSLGQGLSCANGMAIGLRISKKPNRVYALLSDGENQEGQTWEAVMTAAHRGLDNITAFVDFNKQQIDGDVADIKALEPLHERWKSFGWFVQRIDGHDIEALLEAVNQAAVVKGQPSVIICDTIKGKGVPTFEGLVKYHGVSPSKDELIFALQHLNYSPQQDPELQAVLDRLGISPATATA